MGGGEAVDIVQLDSVRKGFLVVIISLGVSKHSDGTTNTIRAIAFANWINFLRLYRSQNNFKLALGQMNRFHKKQGQGCRSFLLVLLIVRLDRGGLLDRELGVAMLQIRMD